jgi:TIGR03009 family protein
MRVMFVLATLAAASTVTLAQQGAPPVQAVNPGQLDPVLDGWERSLTTLRSLYADCEHTTQDKVFQTREVFKGTAKYLKAPGPGQGSRASLELHKLTPKGLSQDIYEKYICTGTYLYEYAPANKVIRIHDLPQPKAGQVADDNFLSFLFGMKASEAKQRYQLDIPASPADPYYYYLQIHPKLPQDKADFSVARLVMRRDNFLPAQVWFLRPNGNEEIWAFPKVSRDVAIPAATFEQPKLPVGWKFEKMPAQTKPKIRGNGP